MSKLIVEIRRGKTLLGSWPVGAEPLEFTLRDAETRADIAVFTAQAPQYTENTTFVRTQLTGPPSEELTMPEPDPTDAPPTLLSQAFHRDQGDDFTMPLPDISMPPGSNGAEIWRRIRQTWRLAGRLPPGHQLKAFGGSIALQRNGTILLQPGAEMFGTATLADGQVIAIQPSGDRLTLPPGVGIMLRCQDDGLYIRTVAPDD